ncbi:MAG: demethoxyubiquinone hydroxylase family protein, partial [Pseudomonadota bacterium]
QEHLTKLPADDLRSRSILEQMLVDEGRHAVNAQAAGAAELPTPIKGAMTLMAQIMKAATYRI